MIRVTIFNEFWHERHNPQVAAIYPEGIHGQIKKLLSTEEDIEVRHLATLDMPEHGLTEEVLADTDVLVYWAHCRHDYVADEVVQRVHSRILDGMGLVLLHSGHGSKLFRKLMGTRCNLAWADDGDLRTRVCVIDRASPITKGIPQYFELEQDEMYGEPFDIPQPDRLIFVSWCTGGEVFRSGCCWHRGKGKIFYFSPGHEEFPIYHNRYVAQILRNGVRWAADNADR